MIILPAIVSEFPGRRLLRIFTSYDRTKIGFEFEQISSNPDYRYIFDIDGTIDRVDNITDALGHKPSLILGLDVDPETGQDKMVIYSDNDASMWALFYFSPSIAFQPVTLTYTTEEERDAPYGSETQFIVQEDDFDYGPAAGATPPVETYYLIPGPGDYLVTEGGDRLIWRAA